MCRRGDIYYADLGAVTGNCQCGVRPVIVVSNDAANTHSPVVTVVPLTTRIKRLYLPTHVVLHHNDATGLNRRSLALCEQVRSLDKVRLMERIGSVSSGAVMDRITHALQVQIGVFPK